MGTHELCYRIGILCHQLWKGWWIEYFVCMSIQKSHCSPTAESGVAKNQGTLLGGWWVNPDTTMLIMGWGQTPRMHRLVGHGGNSGSSKLFTREESMGAVVSHVQDRQENDHAQVCDKTMTKHRRSDRRGTGKEEGNSLGTKGDAEDRWTEITHWALVLMGRETQERALGTVIMESIWSCKCEILWGRGNAENTGNLGWTTELVDIWCSEW